MTVRIPVLQKTEIRLTSIESKGYLELMDEEKSLSKVAIGLKTMFIFGLPCDTEESMKTQARLIQEKIRPEIPAFTSYTPIPGTLEYPRGQKYIRIHDLTYYTFNNSVCDTDFLHYQQVHAIINSLWFNYWAREDNRTGILSHPNQATRKFGRIYYDNLEMLPEYQAL